MIPDILQKIFGCSADRANTYAAPLTLGMQQFAVDTPARQAALFGQLGEESACLVYVEEIDSGVAYSGRADLGNTRPEAMQWSRGNPGPYFKGHGLIQITGYDNHAACGAALYPNDPEIFLRDPRLLCRPLDAARSAAWYWQRHGCNELADAGDFETITRRINGALRGYDVRVRIWRTAQGVLLPMAGVATLVAAPALAAPLADQPSGITAADVTAAEEALHMGGSNNGTGQ